MELPWLLLLCTQGTRHRMWSNGLDQAKNATTAMVSTESCTLMSGATATPPSLALVRRWLDQAKNATKAMVSTEL
jgi:hypothetical protein